MIAVLLLLSQLAQAECLKAVPYRSLGSLKLGAALPKSFKYEPTDLDGALTWANGGGYRVEVTEKGKIDWIQRELGKKDCVVIEGKKLTRGSSAKELREAFPKCVFEAGEGGNSLQCNGYTVLWNYGNDLRIVVSQDDIQSLHAQHAASAARYQIDKDSHGYPIPRR